MAKLIAQEARIYALITGARAQANKKLFAVKSRFTGRYIAGVKEAIIYIAKNIAKNIDEGQTGFQGCS